MKFIIIGLSILISNLLLSQTSEKAIVLDSSSTTKVISIDSIKAIYEREAIFMNNGIGHYYKNGIGHRSGYFFRKLKQELRKSEAASKEIKIYNRKTVRGLTLYFGGIIGGIALSIVTENPLGLVLFVPGIYGAVEITQAYVHLNKAVWLYNRDILLDRAKKLK